MTTKPKFIKKLDKFPPISLRGVPDELWRRFKCVAVMRNYTVTEQFNELLIEFLRRFDHEKLGIGMEWTINSDDEKSTD